MAEQVFILMRYEYEGGTPAILRAYRNEAQAKSALALIKACHAPGLIEVVPVELEASPASSLQSAQLRYPQYPIGGVGIAQDGAPPYAHAYQAQNNGVLHKDEHSNVLS